MESREVEKTVVIDQELVRKGELSHTIQCEKCEGTGSMANASTSVSLDAPQKTRCQNCAGKGTVPIKGIARSQSDIATYLEEPYDEIKPIIISVANQVAYFVKDEYIFYSKKGGNYAHGYSGRYRRDHQYSLEFIITKDSHFKLVRNVNTEQYETHLFKSSKSNVLLCSIDEILLEFDFQYSLSCYLRWPEGEYQSWDIDSYTIFSHLENDDPRKLKGYDPTLSVVQHYKKGYGIIKVLWDAYNALFKEEEERKEAEERARKRAEEREAELRQREFWRSQGLCSYCGGQLGFLKKCKRCGKKNY